MKWHRYTFRAGERIKSHLTLNINPFSAAKLKEI